MRVLFDFTQIPLKRTGVGVYADNLLVNLISVLRDQDTLIVVAQNDDQKVLNAIRGLQNAQLLTIPSRVFRNRALLFGFEQLILPLIAVFQRADLIHSLHYTHPLVAWTRRIVTIHDMTFFLYPELHTRSRRGIMRFFIRHAIKRAEALIFDSQSSQKDAERILPIGDNLRSVAPLGVSPQPIEEDNSCDKLPAELSGSTRYLLFVGTIEPRKNIVRIVQAFERIAKQHPRLQLVFAGKLGWYTDEIVAAIKNSPMSERIHSLGFVSDDQKWALLRNCQVLVYPSLYEGFGLPILEGMAAGAPVVTSNLSSMPEAAGDAALLVDPLDVEAIANAIAVLLEADGQQRQILVKRGKQNVERFTWKGTAVATYSAYCSLISKAQ